MHEASIAQNVLDIAINTATENSAIKINKVCLKIGQLTAIEENSLKFAFDALKEDTMAANAELLIEHIPIVGKCNNCGKKDTYSEMFFSCSNCGSYKMEILSGEELSIKEIEVD
jgi:hydrogenase nickel incorporation protein HypA/HybF